VCEDVETLWLWVIVDVADTLPVMLGLEEALVV
jgi:hypothetical protein